jgi:hypothetical protein
MLQARRVRREARPGIKGQVSAALSVSRSDTPDAHARGVLLKGVGLDILYPNLPALTAFTLVTVGASVWRFRKQLS